MPFGDYPGVNPGLILGTFMINDHLNEASFYCLSISVMQIKYVRFAPIGSFVLTDLDETIAK